MSARRLATFASFVAVALSALPALSCGGDLEAPAAQAEVHDVEPLEVHDDYVVPAHLEAEPVDGVALVYGDDFDATLEGDEVILHTLGVRERWNEYESRWVAELEPPQEPAEGEEQLLLARQARLAEHGVELGWEDQGHEAFLPSGESFLFVEVSGRRGYGLAVLHGEAGGTDRLEMLPGRHAVYATYATSVIARAANDVWVFASETSGKDFGDDFPGCPIIVRHSQDGGYLAHYDGRSWREVAWPAPGEPLQQVIDNADGSIDVVTGREPNEMYPDVVPDPLVSFHIAKGAASLERGATVEQARAARLGWSMDPKGLVRAGYRVALPEGRVTRIVAVDAHEAFVQIAHVSAETIATYEWLHVR